VQVIVDISQIQIQQEIQALQQANKINTKIDYNLPHPLGNVKQKDKDVLKPLQQLYVLLDQIPSTFSEDPGLKHLGKRIIEKEPKGLARGNKTSKGLACFLGRDNINFLDFSFGMELISSFVGFPKTSIISSSWVLAKNKV